MIREVIKYVIKPNGGTIYLRGKLFLLMFLLDWEYFERHGKPLTQVTYKLHYLIPFSPEISTAIENLKYDGEIKIEKVKDIRTWKQVQVIALREFGINLSENLKEEIRETLSPFVDKTFRELSDLIYDIPEVEKTPFGDKIVFKKQMEEENG